MLVGTILYRTYKVIVTFASIVIFIQGAISILVYQALINAFYGKNLSTRQKLMDLTKKRFILLLVTILSLVAPSHVRITTDNESIPKGTIYMDHHKGRLISKANSNAVVIANHQIYTDWVFLWWLAYVSERAGNVYIMLKKSLESIPLLGSGMTNYKFIFMNRKWEKDRINLSNKLHEIDLDARGVGIIAGNSPTTKTEEGLNIWDEAKVEKKGEQWPYWLILFPEGTNLSAGTRARNKAFAEKSRLSPFKHVLLPRTTGLKFCLQKLRNSCEYVYDITIAYSGVRAEEYGQDIYKLGNIFLKGKAPKLVDIYIRAIRLDDIPLEDDEEFHSWLFSVWDLKDKLLDNYYKTGSFQLDPDLNHAVTGPCRVSILSLVSILLFPVLTMLPIFYYIGKKATSLVSKDS
ncbi:Cst26 [Kluyveromyces lactis]|nr:Cst26 [Kluyveromyces lactis]